MPTGFSDIFEMFGGSGGGMKDHHRSGPKKGKSVLHPVKTTLEDLYNGKVAKIVVNRDRICSKCNGKGGIKEGAVKNCNGCKGQGMKTTMQMIGPGMYT